MQPYVKGKRVQNEIHKSKNHLQRESGKTGSARVLSIKPKNLPCKKPLLRENGKAGSFRVLSINHKNLPFKKLVKGKRQRESIWEKVLITKLRESARREGVAKLSIKAKNRSALLRCGTVLITIQEKLYRKGIIRRILLLRPFWQFSLRA